MVETNKKMMNADEVVISTKVVANIFDVSTRRINQLVEEGIIDKIKAGSFKLVPTVRKYVLYLKTKNDTEKESNSTEEDYNLEHMLLEKAKREKAELELALMKGSMHDGSDVEREMNKMLTAFRSKVLSIPSKIAPKVIGKSEISIIEDMLRDELYNALKELSEYDPELFQHESYVKVDDEDNEVVIDGG